MRKRAEMVVIRRMRTILEGEKEENGRHRENDDHFG